MQETSLLTSNEAAKRLGVSLRTVARMASDGRLPPAYRVPGYRGSLLFSVEAVEARRKIEMARFGDDAA